MKKIKNQLFFWRVWSFYLPTELIALTETNEEQLWHEVRHFFLLAFAFCPVGRTRCERWLKHSSVLQLLQHSEFDLSLCSWPLFLQAIIDVAQHLPWLEGQRRWPQRTWIWSLKTVCYTEPHWTQDYFWTTVHPLHSYISSCFKARQGRAVWSYPTPPFSWPAACRDLCCGKATVSPSEDAEAERWFLLTCWASVIPTATGVLGWSHTYCSASHATTINTEQIGE